MTKMGYYITLDDMSDGDRLGLFVLLRLNCNIVGGGLGLSHTQGRCAFRHLAQDKPIPLVMRRQCRRMLLHRWQGNGAWVVSRSLRLRASAWGASSSDAVGFGELSEKEGLILGSAG